MSYTCKVQQTKAINQKLVYWSKDWNLNFDWLLHFAHCSLLNMLDFLLSCFFSTRESLFPMSQARCPSRSCTAVSLLLPLLPSLFSFSRSLPLPTFSLSALPHSPLWNMDGTSPCVSRQAGREQSVSIGPALCMHLNTSLSNLSTCQQHMFCKKLPVGVMTPTRTPKMLWIQQISIAGIPWGPFYNAYISEIWATDPWGFPFIMPENVGLYCWMSPWVLY